MSGFCCPIPLFQFLGAGLHNPRNKMAARKRRLPARVPLGRCVLAVCLSPFSWPRAFRVQHRLYIWGSRRHSSPYCSWSLWWIPADRTFSPRNLITMRCSTLRGTFCSLITLATRWSVLATPRQDWSGSNPSRREGGGCGFTLSRSHSCCAVRLVYKQISPGHIWTTFYMCFL